MSLAWHALRTLWGHEELIARAARDLGIEALCPLYRTEWVDPRGTTRQRIVPLFATYVLLHCNLDGQDGAELWHKVMAMRGAVGFVGQVSEHDFSDDHYKPLRASEVVALRAQMGADGVIRDLDAIAADLAQTLREMRWGYHLGDDVRIRHPAKQHLIGHQGVVNRMEDWGTFVGISIFERLHEVCVPPAACERV